jgi:acetyltransferase AlgX (SGNH hydrolase-like protein)
MTQKRFVLRTTTSLLFAAYVLFASTFLLFTVLEFVPSLADHTSLQQIRYYAQRRDYQPDPTLVFIPSRAGHASRLDTDFLGDQYSPDYGVPHAAIPYHATYTPDGFRENSSSPPFEIMLIGDSYVEFGETDQLTLSEQLTLLSGLTTFNLGRGWYGPFQYLELFKRYAPQLRPRYAVLCFFDGNDIEDTKQYLRWRKGKSYYTFVFSTKNYLGRYFTAFRDSYKFLLKQVERVVERRRPTTPATAAAEDTQAALKQGEGRSSEVHPDLGLVTLRDRLLPMQFRYWNQPLTTEQLLESEEWQAVGQVLKDFQLLAAEHGTVPVTLFIPKKVEVYGAFYSPRSGHNFLQRIREHMRFENNSHDAFLAIAEQAGIRAVDLLPGFRTLAREGTVLYYPFDTHWNPLGRRTAAEILAASLRKLPASAATVCGGCDTRSALP